jgi:hypothetical protein
MLIQKFNFETGFLKPGRILGYLSRNHKNDKKETLFDRAQSGSGSDEKRKKKITDSDHLVVTY